MKRKWKKGIAVILTASLLFGNAWAVAPAQAAVRQRTVGEFEELPDDIRFQTVPYGTKKKSLELPRYLNARLEEGEDAGEEEIRTDPIAAATPSQAERVTDEDGEVETVPVSTGSDGDRADGSDGEIPGEWKRVKVNWNLNEDFSEQDTYDGEVPGVYVFEAELSGEKYELGGAELPIIEVEVLEEEEKELESTPSDAGEKLRITDWSYLDGGSLSDDGSLILYGENYGVSEVISRLPSGIRAIVEEKASAEILSLTWTCPDYQEARQEKRPADGEYLFVGELPEGYVLSEEAGEIEASVTVKAIADMSLEEQARMMEQEQVEAEKAAIAGTFRRSRAAYLSENNRSVPSGFTFVIGGELVLRELAEKVNSGATWADGQISYADSSYILTDDIGLTETWTPIGNETHPFAGSFDGDGYTVDGLRIRENAGEGAGLFGVMDGGTVQNLGVTGAAVAGEGNVGVIAGTLRGGVIRRCFTSGSVTVSGEGGNAGGIAGCMEQDGSAAVENCHSKAQVNGVSGGLQKLGGIVGFVSAGQVAGCYSTGVIAGDKLAERFLGGVVGLADSGAAIRSCAALNLSVDNFAGAIANADRIVGVEGAGVSEAVLENNYACKGIRTNAGGSYWPGNGADTPAGESLSYTAEQGFQPALDRLFTSEEGWETGRNQLPVLSGIRGQDKTVPDWITSGIPLTRSLSSEADLKAFRDDVNAGKSYEGGGVRLTADIDLTGNWTPIGTIKNPFKGTFDGEGHVISGMKIDTPDKSECGFFGVITGGTIKNLGLKNVDIKGRSNVGAVLGYADKGGTISCCYSDGRIDAFLYAGGIIGMADGVRIENCHSAVAVEVEGAGGGIVGGFTVGNTMKNCYSTGCLTGSSMLGGLLAELGDATNTISNCAALNPSIAELNHNKIGYRVVNGNNPRGTRENNFAFSAMKVNGAAITDDDSRSMNGKNLTYNHTTQTFDTGWEVIFDGTEAWVIEPGRLPVLKGVGGQDGAMPQWITDSEAADLYIGTEAELRAFRDRINSSDDDIYDGIKDKRVALTADILLTEEWEPIGAWAGNAFQGTFEGGGHVIRGLRQNRGGYCGLFGHVEGGAVRNLGLEDARLTGNAFIGAIAGEVVDGQIEGCYSRGSVVEGVVAGGLAGAMSGNSAVRNSYSTGVVRGSAAAGLVGGQRREITEPSDRLTVENSYSIATVISEAAMAGGLVGGAAQLQVRDSAALNVSLRESTGGSSLIHRIGGSAGDLTAENNWAFSDMPVNGKKAAGDDGTGLNGRDGAREAITGNAVLFPDSSWVRAQGCYPVLRAFAGQEPFSYADGLAEQAENISSGIDVSAQYSGNFPSAEAGYTPYEMIVTVSNTGILETGELTVALAEENASSSGSAAASYFILSGSRLDSICAGESAAFTVRPAAGLAAGTYRAKVSVNGIYGQSGTIALSFTVRERESDSSGGDSTSVLHGTWERLDNGIWKFRITGGGYASYRWALIGGRWYYFNAEGQMMTGWQYINGVWYYLATAEDAGKTAGLKEGDMVTGWKQISGKWYYFYENGAMAVNTRIDGYAIGPDGAWAEA